jgi:hypothetical protein
MPLRLPSAGADTADMRLASLLSKTAPEPAATPVVPDGSAELPRPRLVRCECRNCGAHCNAIAAHGVYASCGNCGASGLVPVEGAAVIVGA